MSCSKQQYICIQLVSRTFLQFLYKNVCACILHGFSAASHELSHDQACFQVERSAVRILPHLKLF